MTNNTKSGSRHKGLFRAIAYLLFANFAVHVSGLNLIDKHSLDHLEEILLPSSVWTIELKAAYGGDYYQFLEFSIFTLPAVWASSAVILVLFFRRMLAAISKKLQAKIEEIQSFVNIVIFYAIALFSSPLTSASIWPNEKISLAPYWLVEFFMFAIWTATLVYSLACLVDPKSIERKSRRNEPEKR